MRTRRLQLTMLLTIAAVVAAVLWDKERESDATLAAMSSAQLLLAKALTGDRTIEIPGELLVLQAGADAGAFIARDGRVFSSPRLAAAVRSNVQTLTIPREESASFGLPRRRAIAALAPSAEGTLIVLSTAQRERERQDHATLRVIAAIFIVSVIVMGFGLQLLREQRRVLSSERDAQLLRMNKLATMAALAGGVAHEIATPLGVIVSRAEQIGPRVADDERASKAAATILDQAAHIERVMRGFLALSRGEGTEAVPVALSTIARDAAALVAHRFEAAGVALAVHATAGDVLGDPVLLTHAAVNLLLNACEASPAGSTVRFEAGEGLTVTDRGPGIDATTAARVQQPFFTTKRQGSGLGLAIAREVATHHGGSLKIEAVEPGPGTRAVIALPIMKRAQT